MESRQVTLGGLPKWVYTSVWWSIIVSNAQFNAIRFCSYDGWSPLAQRSCAWMIQIFISFSCRGGHIWDDKMPSSKDSLPFWILGASFFKPWRCFFCPDLNNFASESRVPLDKSRLTADTMRWCPSTMVCYISHSPEPLSSRCRDVLYYTSIDPRIAFFDFKVTRHFYSKPKPPLRFHAHCQCSLFQNTCHLSTATHPKQHPNSTTYLPYEKYCNSYLCFGKKKSCRGYPEVLDFVMRHDPDIQHLPAIAVTPEIFKKPSLVTSLAGILGQPEVFVGWNIA